MDLFIKFVILSTIFGLGNLECIKILPHTLNCTSREFTSIPQNLPRNVRTLDLSENNISQLITNVLQLYPYITQLNLDYNEIRSTNSIKTIAELTKLKEFYISSNDLHHFDFSVFIYNQQLEKIVANNNLHISIKEKAVHDMKQLKVISLQRNRLLNFPLIALKGFSGLEMLDLSENGLKVVPDNLDEIFPNLEMLILLRNPLKQIEQVLMPKRYLVITSGTEYFDKSQAVLKNVEEIALPGSKEVVDRNKLNLFELETLDDDNVNETDALAKFTLKKVSEDNAIVIVGVILVIFLTFSVLCYFVVISRNAYQEQIKYQFLMNAPSTP